jgi:hypothetical protein
MAANETPQNNSVTQGNVPGSDALTAKSKLANARVRAKTLRRPSANPAMTGVIPYLITIRNTSLRWAPMAIRIPISRAC